MQTDSTTLTLGLDPWAWRDEIALALDESKPVLQNIINITASDPNRYLLLGGDAMIRNNGKAVLVEFNNFPDILKYHRLEDCANDKRLVTEWSC